MQAKKTYRGLTEEQMLKKNVVKDDRNNRISCVGPKKKSRKKK